MPTQRVWARDELILALDLYHRVGARVSKEHPEVRALSKLLRSGPRVRDSRPDVRYRSTGAVHLKLQNFLSLDPAYSRSALGHVGAGDRELWVEYAGRGEDLSWEAFLIKGSWLDPEILAGDGAVEKFPEGSVSYALHKRYERSGRARRLAKRNFLNANGRMYCEICEFDFGEQYGELGREWIEVHHDLPVSALGKSKTTRVKDLRMVCANCHRMLHCRRPWLTVAGLRRIMRSLATVYSKT